MRNLKMKTLKKSFKKNKSSLFSVLLAGILALTFNYSPITLIAERIKSAIAYKSSTLQTYYPTPSTGNESNISSGNYPKALQDYFTDSSNNFNIKTYYDTRFLDLYSEKVDLYLRSVTTYNYKEIYEEYMNYKNSASLYEFYNNESTYLNTTYSCSTFYGFVEAFLTQETKYKATSNQEITIPALFNKESKNQNRSEYYCALANFINNENKVVETINDKWDNVATDASDTDFYKDSYSYSRVKTAIDDVIVKTVAIYSYDGITQSNTVGAIIANDAPISSAYYYKDSTYVSDDKPSYSYSQKTTTKVDVSVTNNEVYYFGNLVEISSSIVYTENKDFFKIDETTTLTSNPLQYRKILSGEFGFIDNTHPTYYKYEAIPYQKTNDRYNVYVLDDSVSDNEQATYDALYYSVITSDDLTHDRSLSEPYYVQIPYSSNIEYYFEKISGLNGSSFTNFCETFAPDGTSRIYLKLNNNATYNVYIDKNENDGTDAQAFLEKFKTYKYNVKDVTITDANKNDYYKVTTSYSNYYKTEYVLYFEKVKVNYSELVTENSSETTVYDGTYETKKTPSIPYEKNTVPSKSYVIDLNGKVIYALSDEASVTIGSKTYNTITSDVLDAEKNRNVYVEVPETTYKSIYGEAERTNKLYFKHMTEETNQIYIVVEDKKESEEKANEVYKNLYYKVITKTEYKNEFSKYVAIAKTDSNYNENFDLYYKYNQDVESENLYVQNEIRKGNAVFIIDDSLTVADKNAYSLNLYTVITTEEYNKNQSFYVQISDNDENYSNLYTKLYYKYNASAEKERVLYIYSSSSSDTYTSFYNTNSDYVASDYELVQPTDTKYYKDGVELYFKKIRKEVYKDVPQNTYYYFNTSSSVSLKANSYYMLSFYVNTTGELAEASIYVEDTSSNIKDLAFENISTNGAWVKYVAFIATDSINSSTIKISMYMGNKNSILGSHASDTSISSITGSVLFDEIKITTIGLTDFTKRAVDDKVVEETEEHKDSSDTVISTVKVVIANDSISTNVYDNRYVSLTNSDSWSTMFNFEQNALQELIGNLDPVTTSTDGYTPYSKLWQYYISRDVSVQGKNDKLTQVQNAYIANDLIASILQESTIDKTPITSNDDDEDETTDDKTKDDSSSDEDKTDEEESTDVANVPSTFKNDNYILKLQNKNRLLSLGIVSNSFVLRRAEYYKITVWIYSPDEEATATISLNSVLKTGNKLDYGSLLQTTASEISANIAGYTTTPTNEYGWIPISFYVEGNTLHDQNCNLVLSSDKNRTVYFDNISIENISSSAYDTASSDSDNTTYCLSLNPSTSVITNNVTNGYFNNITLKENYRTPDATAPRTAKSWTLESTSSTNTISGILPTSKNYTDLSDNFYDKYNDGNIPYADGYDETNAYTNVYGIYAPTQITSTIKNADDTLYNARHNYKIYSSSMSLSASSVYDMSFDFYKGTAFTGNMVANIYYGSVATDKLISSFKLDASEFNEYEWNTFHFYIGTGTSSVTIYIEIGVTEATGTVFFKNVSGKTSTKSLDEIRDELITNSDNSEATDSNLFEKDSLCNAKFINFKSTKFSILDNTADADSGLYNSGDYSVSTLDTSKYTIGESGVAVANFFTSNVTTTYSVTISSVVYYIGSTTNKETSETTYHLYKYSDLTEEVTEIDGKQVTVESFKKVIVGKGTSATENTTTSTDKTNYSYKFTKDYTLNNVVVPASELNNNYSQNVMVLANSYTTDFTTATAKYTTSLDTSAYYVLKIYVKTSDFDGDDIGLNIKVNAVSTTFDNINTTKLDSSLLDENGFACYQVLISTNKSSISNLSVTYSLASEDITGKGYAIIAGSEIEKFSSEDLFNHYVETLGDNETTVKKFYGTKATSDSDDDDSSTDSEGISWATFFYIFSSLLLVLTLAIAIVSIILKKHPIKFAKKYTNDHERNNKTATIDITTNPDVASKKVKKSDEKVDDNNSSKDGII